MYTPLYIKTDYSLLSSLIKIDKLLLRLKELHITSCSIVDNNLFGTMEFITKCQKENIKPIIGLEININDKVVLLYAKNLEGYYNLVKLESIKNEQELTLNDLDNYKNNLIVICFDKELFATLQKLIKIEDLFYGVNNYSLEKECDFTSNICYINKTLYLKNYEYKYLPYVFMIRDGKTISDKIEFIYQDNYLKSNEEVESIVSKVALDNTLKISERCNVSFKKELFMPKYDTLNSKEYLINLANKGLKKRLNGNVLLNYQKRLDYELDIIIKMHFEDYFLVVYDYIKYAKLNDILVGPGRGSAAGSLVCYSLGITDVDPIKYDLLFERFLNQERITLPDIDTDFPDNERDKVINYVKEKYGSKKVSGIITFGTLKSKQAIRDVGRVLNIKMEDIDYLCQKINNNESLFSLKKRSVEVSNFIEADDKLKMLYNIVLLIENNKRHTSIHAAGIVISYKNLDEIIPIYKNDNFYLTEYTMEYLEQLGLIKMDFLGLRNLTIIKNILNDIKEENITISFNKIPLEDKKVYDIFKKGDTTGIFQFESEGMKRFLKDLEPDNFIDISNALALYRPGPAINIPTFINRRKQIEKDYQIIPSLKEVLESTYGIIIYQEQIMKIANIMANYTLQEADLLRRAMSKKKLDILKQEEEKFIKNSLSNGYSLKEAKEVYDLILRFANYGFNKSHSICYATIAYKMAYLKTYFPKYFYSNLLESVIGSEVKTKEYLNEVKKLGIKILSPDVNYSYETKYRVTKEGIRLPLSSIRNVGEVIAHLIVTERNKQEFNNLYDFLTRTYRKTNNIKVLESLIYSHALSSFNYNITTLINNLDLITNYIELGESLVLKPVITHYEDDIDEILEQEKKLFGFYLTSHKTEKYKLKYKNIIDINMISSYFNKNINLIGSIDKIKEVVTKNNSKMLFLTISDSTGSISVTVFPKKYQEISNMELKKGVIILINGRVEKRFNEYQLILDKIKIC